MWPPRDRAGKQPFFLEICAVAIWSYLVFALLAGAMLPIQFGINAQLAHWVGGSIRAAFVSFVVGAVSLFLAVLVAQRGCRIARATRLGGSGSAACSGRSMCW